MSRALTNVLAIAGVFSLCSSVMASSPAQQTNVLQSGSAAQQSSAQAASLPQQTLSFDQFKESCVNPAQFNRQIPPTNIRVICKSLERGWEQLPSVMQTMPGKRLISAALQSSKYQVLEGSKEAPGQNFNYGCPQYKEVEKTFSTERAISCEDVLKSKGSLEDLCQDILDQELSQNSKLVNVRDTGNIMGGCPTIQTRVQGKPGIMGQQPQQQLQSQKALSAGKPSQSQMQEPVKPAEPTKPSLAGEPAKPSEPTEPTEPVKPSEPTKPAGEPAKPSEPGKVPQDQNPVPGMDDMNFGSDYSNIPSSSSSSSYYTP